MATGEVDFSQLTQTELSLTDIFAKSNTDGDASGTTMQKIVNLINTTTGLDFKGVLLIADTPEQGWYFAGESGTFTNADNLVVTLTNTLTIIINDGSANTKLEVPVTVSLEDTTFDADDNSNGATMKLIQSQIEVNTDVLGLENRAKNKVVNANLTSTDNWSTIGATLTDGVFYLGQENYGASQVITLDEQPIGTQLVFASKMKSIAETDYFFKVTLLNDGGVVSGGSFTIGIGDDDTFLKSDGYYQILKKFTTTTLIDQINIEFKAKNGGSNAYSSGEGVFAYNPYIAIYEDGDEFFFEDNDYFPDDYIKDFSKFSETTNSLSESAKTELKTEISNENKIYDDNVLINNLGDSYTELAYDDNRGYIYFASQYLDLDKVTNFGNYGIGGTKLANSSLTITDAQAMVNRYDVIPVGDAFGILGGFNDNNAPFSTWTEKLGSEATKSDTNTIWGALCTIIEGRITQYPYNTENVYILTYPYTQNDTDKISLNQTLRDVADYYNIPLLDLEKLCGIKEGLNAALDRTSLADGVTWIDERRISFIDGKTIWNIVTNPTSSADIYSYHENFIPVDNTLYSYINRSTQSNIMQYKHNGGSSGTDADYDYLGYDLNSTVYETKLDDECTHVRFSVQTTAKAYKYSVVDGEYVTDDIHLNLLGMRNKVAPIYTEFIKSLLKRK